jgi:hypothetical protein
MPPTDASPCTAVWPTPTPLVIGTCTIALNSSCPGADLSSARGYRGVLTGEDLSGMNLSGANLAGVDLSWSVLKGTNLSGANLRWARLDFADVDDANFAGAKTSWSTTCVDGSSGPCSGTSWTPRWVTRARRSTASTPSDPASWSTP